MAATANAVTAIRQTGGDEIDRRPSDPYFTAERENTRTAIKVIATA